MNQSGDGGGSAGIYSAGRPPSTFHMVNISGVLRNVTQQSFEGRTSSKNAEYGTPAYIYDPLNEEFKFTFDLAATARSTKVPGRFFTKADDALNRDWPAGVNWLNPPYSRRVGHWIVKARDEAHKGHCTNVVLINANTESQWFQHVAVPFAHEIRLLEYRIPFIDWDTVYDMESEGATPEMIEAFIEDGNGAYHPSCLLVFRSDVSTIPQRRVFDNEKRFAYVSF